MYGAIIGDIVGSKYEFDNIKTKEFPLISEGSRFTDDTVMTVAVAKALLCCFNDDVPFRPTLVHTMRTLGLRYPDVGYGRRFSSWLHTANPKPYNSYGNGSAMRVSPCGLIALTMDEALELAKASAEVTHDHPEGIEGAQATAAAVFLAKSGVAKEEIALYIQTFFYDLSGTLDDIRPNYQFDVSCQNSVPQAIMAFLESESYEDAIRNAVSIGGDSDTIAAIAGSIAWAYYRFRPTLASLGIGNARSDEWPLRPCERLLKDFDIEHMLPEEFLKVINDFKVMCERRTWLNQSLAFRGFSNTKVLNPAMRLRID